MRHCKLIFVLLFIFLFILVGCTPYNEDGIYYYESLQDALLDINDGRIGRRDQNKHNNSSIMVDLQDGIPTICLLKNITTDYMLRLKDTNLNLNGYALINNQTALIKTYGTCRIYNGSLYKSCNNEGSDGLIINKGSICHIENVIVKTESLSRTNIAIHNYGEMFLVNSTIKAFAISSDQSSVTVAVYGNIFSSLHIEGSNIIAQSDFGRVDGVYIGDTGWLSDSYIIACANYRSNQTTFTSCAIGCSNAGTLTVNNCHVYGVHSGIDSSGALLVDGGTYRGYGHGGIYCAGINRTNIITNATILQDDMPSGYIDMGVGCMEGGLYIGGGKNKDNITVFIDNCIIKATKNPIVLRGTSGEKNNSLYISNTILDIKHIRVDNNTHRIYLGKGCNFEASHTDVPDIVICTGISYAKP